MPRLKHLVLQHYFGDHFLGSIVNQLSNCTTIVWAFEPLVGKRNVLLAECSMLKISLETAKSRELTLTSLQSSSAASGPHSEALKFSSNWFLASFLLVAWGVNIFPLIIQEMRLLFRGISQIEYEKSSARTTSNSQKGFFRIWYVSGFRGFETPTTYIHTHT